MLGAGKVVATHIPGTSAINPARRQFVEDKRAAQVRNDERAKLQAQKEFTAQSTGTETATATTAAQAPKHANAQLGVDARNVKGDYLTEFNNTFVNAMTRGHRRDTSAESPEMLIRQIVCQPSFIAAIASGEPRTPLEHVDSKYRDHMRGIRSGLAAQLTRASQDVTHVMQKPTTHEMDVIFTTMLSTPLMWNTPAHAGGPAQPWPADVPKPDQAFHRFLENVAIRTHPGDEGVFIGNVLKDLATKPTMVGGRSDPTFTNMIDRESVNGYLSQKCTQAIETTVSDFRTRVLGVLTTPKTDMDPVTEMPGIGCTVPQDILQDAYARAETAQTRNVNMKNAYERALTAARNADIAESELAAAEKELTDFEADYRGESPAFANRCHTKGPRNRR